MLTTEQIETVKQRLAGKVSIDDIAREFGYSRNTLEKYVMAAGWCFSRSPIKLVRTRSLKLVETDAANQ